MNEILVVIPLTKRALKFKKYTRMHLQPTEIFFPRRNLDPTPRPFSWKRDIPYKTQPQLSFSPATYYWKWKLRLVGCYHNLWDTLLQWSHTKFNNITAKPVLSGYCIKQTPSIKRTVAKVPKFISLLYFRWNLNIKRTWTPTMYLKWSFLLLPNCIKRTLAIKFYHPTC